MHGSVNIEKKVQKIENWIEWGGIPHRSDGLSTMFSDNSGMDVSSILRCVLSLTGSAAQCQLALLLALADRIFYLLSTRRVIGWTLAKRVATTIKST